MSTPFVPAIETTTSTSITETVDVKPREKKRSYTVEEKLAIVQAAKTESLRAVSRRFNVDRNCIRSWREKESQLAELHPNAKRLPGAGRRPVASVDMSLKRKVSESIAVEEKKIKRIPSVSTSDDFLLVGFQGKEGAFSDVAARTAFDHLKRIQSITPGQYETVGYGHVSNVLQGIESGQLKYGVLPMENSISGTFHDILDLLMGSELHIVGEIASVQELCVCALEDTKIEEIECFLSHPAILDHCEAFVMNLEKQVQHTIDRQATWDSAGACHMVKQSLDRTVAAIASEQAAETHGLIVLAQGVGNELHHETRYAILARRDTAALDFGEENATMKTSLVVAIPNEPQALFKIVSAFALRNITIIKIESRPASTAKGFFTSQTYHWDYIFFIDYIASTEASVNDRLMEHLKEFALWVKHLGTYSSGSVPTNVVESPRWKSLCNLASC